MSSSRGTIVTLFLFTQDDDLANKLNKGLQAKGLDNKVRRASTEAELRTYTQSELQDDPFLILLDVRAPNTEALSYLSKLQRNKSAAPSVVVTIADDDEEIEPFEIFRNMIAGRISSSEPADDFIKLVEGVLSKNWTMEPSPA